MHADESVQAAIFRDLWQHGIYKYNPNEFHGPTLPYVTLPSVWIGEPANFAETTAATYRIVPVVFGAAMILLIWLLGDALGKPASLGAAMLLAVSPAMVFYSRYFIHETLLIFFTLALLGTSWRYVRSGRLAWCLAAGACLGLMQATKETCAIVYLAMGLALVLTRLWGRLTRDEGEKGDRSNLPERPAGCCAQIGPVPFFARHLVMGAIVAVLVAVTLLSSFFTNPRGPVDAVLAYLPWLSRAGGASPHVHPWDYYLHILAWWRLGDGPLWSEGLILALAAVGFTVALLPRKDGGETWRHGTAERRQEKPGSMFPPVAASPRPPLAASSFALADVPFVRWLGFYTLVLTAAYSAIPYKTPWCLLGPLQGMILLAGVGAVALVRLVPTLPLKALVTIVLLGATAQLAWQSHRTSHELSADPKNPYVYAHTLPDIARLEHDVEQLAEAAPQGHAIRVKVIWKDGYYWPLPWYLRRFEEVDCRTQMPDDPAAPVVISSPEYDAALTEKLDATHLMTGYYGVRPEVLAQLWVRMDVWEAHLRRLGRL